ncbi:MAG: helix-turn-helix transcriptional regulator [Methylococcaceae bacterium]|nr:helix-turn-helix transcriptional regulator [Methylococcaceae bacterium]
MTDYNKHDAEILVAFGLRMREFRQNKGLSQEELAEITDLHRTYIGSAERGERNVSLINIARIAKALDVPVSSLIEDK